MHSKAPVQGAPADVDEGLPDLRAEDRRVAQGERERRGAQQVGGEDDRPQSHQPDRGGLVLVLVILEQGAPLPKMFHALLVAELGDNAGWDLLVGLAREAGDHEATRAFKKRLHEEEDHLLFVRRVVQRFARRDILGQDVRLPSGVLP